MLNPFDVMSHLMRAGIVLWGCCLIMGASEPAHLPAAGATVEAIEVEAPFVSLHDNPLWTFVNVDGTQPYGTKTFKVPAMQHWVNTGVYLKKGESATIEARGYWRYSSLKPWVNADGDVWETERGCQQGELVARMNLHYEDQALTCIGQSGQVTAHQAGVLFVGMIHHSDLADSVYQKRQQAAGHLDVTVTSTAHTIPLVEYRDLTSYAYDQVQSGWVELATRSIIVTVPTQLALQDINILKQSLTRLQHFYDLHYRIRQIYPYGRQDHPQPVRFIADPHLKDDVYMMAGNPVRIHAKQIHLKRDDRITNVGHGTHDQRWWGYAHELGHNFQIQHQRWVYSTLIGMEAWPNVFTVHAQRALGLDPRHLDCHKLKHDYLHDKAQDHTHLPHNPDLGLCFLTYFMDRYGIEFYKRFFSILDRESAVRQNKYDWQMHRADFSEAAGEDVNAVFDVWKLPDV